MVLILHFRNCSWVKLVNVNQGIVANKIVNHLQSRLVYFLMNTHIKKRSIYVCRHGESVHNVLGQIGGDCDLSERGKQVRFSYACYTDLEFILYFLSLL